MIKYIFRSFKAPAKVNLFLKTKKKTKKSKFRNIVTLMWPYKEIFDVISLYIIINDKRNTTKISMTGCKNILKSNNIVYKVIQKFKLKYKKIFSIRIKIQKNIVIGGGLGGGSSDGYYTYLTLCEIFGVTLKPKKIKNFFKNISQDSCYFYYYLPAIVYQPSSTIKLINYRLNIKFNVVTSKIIAKTKDIFNKYEYKNVNLKKFKKIMNLIKIKKQIIDNNVFFNDLEATIEKTYPNLLKIKQKYNNKDIVFSGTGSSLVVFEPNQIKLNKK